MAKEKKMVTIDGNTAAAHVAYAFSEVAAIYPITPSSPMGEYSDEWATAGRKNMFGEVVDIAEMQSEAGAAGAVHGSLTAGALTTTFTASQGLLLMIPNMYKIAGEMLPTVFHVSARSLAAQSLSIFGDHADVMACRATGFAMTAAASIQETMDMALVAHLSTLKSQVPFLSFFDGFRTSHEIQKVEEISYEDIKSLVEPKYIRRFKDRALKPESPKLRVSAQNGDVYFQGRETTNKMYDEVPAIVQEYMDKVAAITGRQYHLFDYVGAKDADKVIIAMGSACDTIDLTVNYLVAKGEKVGAVKVRLFRPFSMDALKKVIPATVKKVAVLDRTKEPGSLGEPLFLDVQAALADTDIKVIGGRYGLSSKEFEPSHVKAIFEHLDGKCFHGFTVGINDDVTFRSLEIKDKIDVAPADVTSCMFWGLGSDGTVGANKDSIKIIGNNTDMNAQAYFVYDSKKSGGITTSHLRFGKSSVNMPWLITAADFVACHVSAYIGRYDMVEVLKKGGTFLLNSEWPTEEVFSHFTRGMQEYIINNNIKVYNINALKIAESVGLGKRISTVMQAAFFKLSNIIPAEDALNYMKKAAEKKFSKKGEKVVSMNWAAIDAGFNAVEEVKVPASVSDIKESYKPARLIPENADDFAKNIIEKSMHLKGDEIPVSHMSFDGILPTATAKLEKRGVAPHVPEWDSTKCIQCNQCSQACPHAAIRPKQIDPADLKNAPSTFVTLKSNTKNSRELRYKIQVYTRDCQGCGVCVDVCPAKEKALKMVSLEEAQKKGEVANEEFFTSLPENVTEGAPANSVKEVQFKQPLFEFSGACAGCGETPYVKLVTQLFGERMIVANATGCSSIYGGTFPTIPYCKRPDGRGPAWGNSLFEDNAEYGFGMRMAVNANRKLLSDTVKTVLENGTTADLKAALEASMALFNDKSEEAITAQKKVAAVLPAALAAETDAAKKAALEKLDELKDYFVDKSVWIFGGDGWAYDIGYGGVDHVVAKDKNVNILVLDTEVYSNTGGQASKSTPIAAVAKFASSGMRLGKKKMPFMCMTYGHVYVASIALGANRAQAQKAFQEAEAWNGPSIIFAYAPCINHGIDMSKAQSREKLAVECGYWPLFRYNPAAPEGQKYVFESKEPTGNYQDFIRTETRYTSLMKAAPSDAEELYKEAEADAKARFEFYKALGAIL
ncbi:MAG: pyruvate:ferredoxin (flavodoxin) oxidoreductase [Spirochaetia bacterium]|nr:pyruvate:ferredoxin (flavodoxin) oxidoreductase [Spirochaetia bacterium]